MFTAQFTFITLTMMILVSISFWMKVPKASIPLLIIYLIFSIKNILSSEINIENKNSYESKNQVNEKVVYYDLENVEQNNNIEINRRVEPKPLTFKAKPEIFNNKRKVNPKYSKTEKNNLDKIKELDNDPIPLLLKDIKICKNIYKRTPVGADNIFTNNVDSLYCYTRIRNAGSKREVKHVWYYENQMMTQVRYNVKKSNIYRSWTKKTILPNQIGNWRVDIQDHHGTIIGSKKFKIKRLSDYN